MTLRELLQSVDAEAYASVPLFEELLNTKLHLDTIARAIFWLAMYPKTDILRKDSRSGLFLSDKRTMKRIALITISILCAVMLQAQDIKQFVNRQMQTYPKSRLLDIYKSCFQDFMGAYHPHYRIVERGIFEREILPQIEQKTMISTPHFQAYKQGTLHMVKSLNLLDIQPLDAAAMPMIFRKQQ